MDNSLNQTTYERFKQDILMFNLKPGDTVSAAKIAERYNVSRTPAREALVKLETEGLVDIIPQSKSVISRIDIDKARQEWFIRRTLELGMVDRFFENLSNEDISQMEYHNKVMEERAKEAQSHENVYAYLLADNDFHAVTYRVSGEYMSENVIKSFRAHYSRLRFLTEIDNYHQGRTVSGHEELISLLKRRDKEAYRRMLSKHLDYIITDIGEMEKVFPDYFVKRH